MNQQMNYIAEPKQRFNPDYEDSDGKRKRPIPDGFEDIENPLERVDPEELVKTDNFLTYEDSNQLYNPTVQPYSYFYITICGQIEFADFLHLDGLSIKFAFVCGDDWQIAEGNDKGQGQYSFKGSNNHSHCSRMVWNLPYDSSSPNHT